MRRWVLTVTAPVSLFLFALLAAHVANGHGWYPYQHRLLSSLGTPSTIGDWTSLTSGFATPAIVAVLVMSLAYGVKRRSIVRVLVYAGVAAATFLLSEHVAKPLVHETYIGVLAFPSGNVTAVCATVAAMWLALYPLLGLWSRITTFVLGAAWVLLMSLAVVGAIWHTPLDALGSVLLSLGIVAACGAAEEWYRTLRGPAANEFPDPPSSAEHDPETAQQVVAAAGAGTRHAMVPSN